MKFYYKMLILMWVLIVIAQSAWMVLAPEPLSQAYDETTLKSKYLGSSEHLITPIPSTLDLNPAKVALGQQLYSDAKLSSNNVSCSTCHNLQNAGMDGLTVSIDARGGQDEVNTPTIFNSGLNFRQFWNGQAHTLEDQLEAVMHNQKHMNSPWPEVITKLQNDADYRAGFDAIYADGIQPDNIKNALATFVRSLVTPNSDFDQFLLGDDNAITEDQKAGYFLFQQYGCVFCHQGVLVGGNVFSRYGVINDPFAGKTHLTQTDMGRYSYTLDENDKHVFKVPGLRNVAVTAPYLHDGLVATLEKTIEIMAWTQLGRAIPESDTRLITEFLKSLTGEYQGNRL